MVQSKPRFATFEDYLAYTNEMGLDDYYELIDGELVELSPEADPNLLIALDLRDALAAVVAKKLIRPGKCEIQVPVLRPQDAANRYPDLVVLREEHLMLLKKRSTITDQMSPPQLVVEVVSPGQTNRERDYIHKRDQYAAREIPEYWIIDPEQQSITILTLNGNAYAEIGTFQGKTPIVSPTFPKLELTPEQVFGI